ncbi:MAG: RsmB/NOP family class I SAM-dependent RNA methyltransferase [Cohaesibacteraceae bacterium]|nr:RsmB/NOP family class I SAM-dependent RNA methyltransferase [Cohaesibacteraceae bacterium]
MKLGGRVQAAIEILQDVEKKKRSVADALRDWGQSHRFAGSNDRAVIGNIVYDVLRKRASIGWKMGSYDVRSLVLGAIGHHWGFDSKTLQSEFQDDRHAPRNLTEAELNGIDNHSLEGAPLWVRAEIPEWLVESFEEAFEEDLEIEGRALSQRPPVDIRVNTLKSTIDDVKSALSKFSPVKTRLSSTCLRFESGTGVARQPNIQSDGAFRRGWFEIQDEGSQIAASLVYPLQKDTILDFCAGAGGKTLAMAALTEDRGQIYAYDADRSRLSPIHNRLERAGTKNVKVITPEEKTLKSLLGRMDRVVVDAPCTGTGIWRRRPDAKWRLTPKALEERLSDQRKVLEEARDYVRPGGYLIYITCSLLPQENEKQVYDFVETNPDFELISAGEAWQELFGTDNLQPWSADLMTITMTPASTQTDGFFFSVMERRQD